MIAEGNGANTHTFCTNPALNYLILKLHYNVSTWQTVSPLLYSITSSLPPSSPSVFTLLLHMKELLCLFSLSLSVSLSPLQQQQWRPYFPAASHHHRTPLWINSAINQLLKTSVGFLPAPHTHTHKDRWLIFAGVKKCKRKTVRGIKGGKRGM